MAHDGFLNLLKPPGMTSHDVVALLRRHLGTRRVGHLGTLDPAAAGVLPVAVGRALRLVSSIGQSDKAYRARLVFGTTTDTLDAEGQVVSRADCSGLTQARVCALLEPLRGEIQQVPPAYSAVQVGGKRLHALARRGEAVEAPARRVRIDQLDLVEFTPGPAASAILDVTCSAGTYIRTLADDLGRAAGCGAHLAFLLRTRAGRFRLEDSTALEEFETRAAEESLLPLDWPLADLPCAELDRPAASDFVGGRRVTARRLAHAGRDLAVPSAPLPVPPSPPLERGPGSEDRRSRSARGRLRVYLGARLLGLAEPLLDGALQPRLVIATPEEVGRCE